MNKVLVIGIVGESVFMKCDHFHKTGETIKVDNIYTEIGGKGFNQALTIKELGGNVKFICALGLDKKKDETSTHFVACLATYVCDGSTCPR